MSTPRVLFICTENVFRSVIAEYTLRAALGAPTADLVCSAGTTSDLRAGRTKGVHPYVMAELAARGIDASPHRPSPLTDDLLDSVDLPIALGFDHQRYVQEVHGRAIPLFHEVAHGRSDPILDVKEVLQPGEGRKEAEFYAFEVIERIGAAMPAFVENMVDAAARLR